MISYKKLWHLLIDRDMTKTELAKQARLSSTTMARMSKGLGMTSKTIEHICKVLECQPGDIMEYIPDDKE